jgi:hypothetical protein
MAGRCNDDGEGDWVRAIDLAARAEGTNPRTVKQLVRGIVGDGAALVCGGAKYEFVSEIFGVNAVDAKNTAGNYGAVARGAIIRAEKVVVTSGKGRTQEVIDLYLNQEAATLVAMRLRTPKAVQLQCEIAHVFVLALKGRLRPVAAPPRTLAELRRAAVAVLGAAIEAEDIDGAKLLLRTIGTLVSARPGRPRRVVVEAVPPAAQQELDFESPPAKPEAIAAPLADPEVAPRADARTDTRPLIIADPDNLAAAVDRMIEIFRADAHDFFMFKDRLVQCLPNGSMFGANISHLRDRFSRLARFERTNHRMSGPGAPWSGPPGPYAGRRTAPSRRPRCRPAGTGQAICIARAHGIPVWNLQRREHLEIWKELLHA